MQPPLLGTVLLGIVGSIGTFVTFAMENPRSEYYSKIPAVKEDRIADVANALGPIVADVHEFQSEHGGQSVESLTDYDRASVAVADSLSPDDDLPDLRDAIRDFYQPEQTYRRCRRARDWTYRSFVGSVLLAVIPLGSRFVSQSVSTLLSVSYVLSGSSIVLGVVFFLWFQRSRENLDEMTEAADFSLE